MHPNSSNSSCSYNNIPSIENDINSSFPNSYNSLFNNFPNSPHNYSEYEAVFYLNFHDFLYQQHHLSNTTLNQNTTTDSKQDEENRVSTNPIININNSTMKKKRCWKKDRHSKINTMRGPRDRRMRLSFEVARKFFSLQDLLGFDKPSRTVDWLLKNSTSAITELEGEMDIDRLSKSESSLCEEVMSSGLIGNFDENLSTIEKPFSAAKKKKKKREKKVRVIVGRESRRKARERARERTSQKIRLITTIQSNNVQPKLCDEEGINVRCSDEIVENPHFLAELKYCGNPWEAYKYNI